MSVEHLTVITCDRCKTESRYKDHWPNGPSHWGEKYALVRPAITTSCDGPDSPFSPTIDSEQLASDDPTVVCLDCLAKDERAQLDEYRGRQQEQADAYREQLEQARMLQRTGRLWARCTDEPF